MPWTVVVASSIQLSIAVAFVIMTWLAWRYGWQAQAAAEEAVRAQGLDDDALARGHVRFSESAVDAVIPLTTALVLVVLAVGNVAGSNLARASTWALQPIVLLLGGLVTASQVFATRQVQAAFLKSGDQQLLKVDVERMMSAAVEAFPRWFRAVVLLRFVLVTIGSACVIVLLSLPMSSSHFY